MAEPGQWVEPSEDPEEFTDPFLVIGTSTHTNGSQLLILSNGNGVYADQWRVVEAPPRERWLPEETQWMEEHRG